MRDISKSIAMVAIWGASCVATIMTNAPGIFVGAIIGTLIVYSC